MKTAALKALTVILIFLPQLACTTTKQEPQPGIQESFVGFIPARIAILPCLAWPEGTRWKTKPINTADRATITSLCETFDKFTLDGFSNQPYMKGYSPTFVERALTTGGLPSHLGKIAGLWTYNAGDCMECTNVASFYRNSIANRPNWQLWLGETSKLVRHADAFLIPTILYAWERLYNDRGVLVVERSASAALLLINANNGELIWAGLRTAVVPVRKLEADLNNQSLAPPEWSLVGERIFTDHLWAQFPGRQVY